jgi:hypothetical protein
LSTPCEGHGAGAYVYGKYGGVDQQLSSANSSASPAMFFPDQIKPSYGSSGPGLTGGRSRSHRRRTHRRRRH